MGILDNLNEKQIEAVMTTEGPVLVLAGPGSGKTRVIAHRIAYLLKEKKVSPFNILAVTFTNKAAEEMAQRVTNLLNKPKSEVRSPKAIMPFLGTFHSICVRILRKEIVHLNYKSNFLIYDEADQISLIKEAMKDIEIDPKKYNPAAILSYISSAKGELIGPKKYTGLASGNFGEIVSKVYFRYQKLLEKHQALDFDDLIKKCVELFQKYPKILAKYQKIFRYILIDEYQDTNHAQYVWANLLAKKYRNICVVGDDWQSIYSFRGANFQNILDFEKDYPEAKIIKLEENYRSTQIILEVASEIITKNVNRSEKNLWTKNVKGDPVVISELESGETEGIFVVSQINHLIRENEGIEGVVRGNKGRGCYSYKDFVVLYRTNAQSRALEEIFLKYKIPYKIVGGVRFYERKEVKDILAYLRFVAAENDVISFKRIINVPPRGLGAKTLELILNFSKNKHLKIKEALKKLEEIKGLTPKAKRGLLDFYKLIKFFEKEGKNLSVPELIDLVIKKTGYLDYLESGTMDSEERILNLQELLSVAYHYQELRADFNLEIFLEEIALITDLDNYNQDSEAVTLMTLHSAKGLEFKVVFLVGMEEGLFPHSRSLLEPAELEEERRLCYVGVTRAKEKVYLTYATSRLIFGGIQNNIPSRFILDIPESLVARDLPPTSGEDSFVEELPQVDLSVGDRIRHLQFGMGRVVSIDDDEIEVDFPKLGVKRLSLTYAPIEKIG